MRISDVIESLGQHGGIARRERAFSPKVWIDGAAINEPKLFATVYDAIRGLHFTGRWKPTVEDLIADDWRILERFERASDGEAA